MLARLMAPFEVAALPLLRIVTGVIFLQHGYAKVFDRGLERTAGFLDHLGFFWPDAWAVVLMGFEFVGGVLAIVGLLTRYVAAGWIVIMLVAIFAVHLPDGDSIDFQLLLLASSAVLMIQGGGAGSLETKLFNREL